MPGPRVLYLHGMRGEPKSIRQSMLAEVYGKENVCNPNLKTRRTIIIFTILFGFYVLGLIAVSIICFFYWTIFGAVLMTMLLFLIACITYILAGRGVTHYMVMNAIQIGEKTSTEFRPNVIVASSFGAIIALSMKTPRVGLVLLAPAQDAYCRYMKIRELFSLDGWPYTMIIHGSKDDVINLDDSIRLVESSDFGKCKLEVIDDDHSLSTLSEHDFRDFVSEAYSRGREEVIIMLSKPNAQKVPLVDASVYDIQLEETSGGESHAATGVEKPQEKQEARDLTIATDVP